MTLTLLDLYNATATQEWAMYDADAESKAEFENSLVLAINKAVTEIFSFHDFPFRERMHVILTIPNVAEYELPNGLIKRDKNKRHLVKYNSVLLDYIENPNFSCPCFGNPSKFFIKNNHIYLYPVPADRGILTIEYTTLSIGEDSNGKEIYSLKNDNDVLSVPRHLEELAKEAIITRAMLNTIASETDENYSAYKKQADNALKLLIKYSKGVEQDKRATW
jgi:hypothetical protein